MDKEIKYYNSGNIYCEEYRQNGYICREDGDNPSIIFYFDSPDKKIKEMQYFNKNRFTRTDFINFPCIIKFYENGNVKQEVFYRFYTGIYKKINYYISGNISGEFLYKFNKLHNDDNNNEIAYIEYYDNKLNSIKTKKYYNNGKLCRTKDRPAVIKYYENGEIKKEEYYLLNNRHRSNNKPAVIEYYENTNIKTEKYYINGFYKNENDKFVICEYSEDGNTIKETYLNEFKQFVIIERIGLLTKSNFK